MRPESASWTSLETVSRQALPDRYLGTRVDKSREMSTRFFSGASPPEPDNDSVTMALVRCQHRTHIQEGIVKAKRPPLTRFSLQVWPEDTGEGQVEWRGKVQHVTSGDARYFRDWPTMVAFLECSLSATITTRADEARGDL